MTRNPIPLAELRARIEALASPTGEYVLRCCRLGDRPVPATGLRFESRPAARVAARVTEQYRATLRRYDPALPRYDVVVCQEPGPSTETGDRAPAEGDGPTSTPALAGQAGDARLVGFCHRVAAAVFETLSEAGYAAVESAILDAYVELAAAVPDPDELCLRLLERLSIELETRLEPEEQATVLFGAASRLDPLPAHDEPLRATLERLGRRGLVGETAYSPTSTGSTEERSITIHLPQYALAPRNGRLPVVPLVVTLARHGSDRSPSSVRATGIDAGWRLTIEFAGAAEPVGLASAPIGGSE